MTKKKITPPPTPSKSALLNVVVEPGKTGDQKCAEMASSGLIGNAITLVNFSRGGIGELSLNDCLTVLREKGDAVNRGDMRAHEAMLSAQAVALNAIFGEFARRAAVNMGEHIGAMETYARLAMKAQSQCRSTIETLAEMKNPPVVFARQANISNGPQQVNNGISAGSTEQDLVGALPVPAAALVAECAKHTRGVMCAPKTTENGINERGHETYVQQGD